MHIRKIHFIADVTAEIFKIKNCSVGNLFKYTCKQLFLYKEYDIYSTVANVVHIIYKHNFCVKLRKAVLIYCSLVIFSSRYMYVEMFSSVEMIYL